MAMKLSQLKREGAKEHSHSHSQDPSMPPLKSGGMFSKNLREINLKVSLDSCCIAEVLFFSIAHQNRNDGTAVGIQRNGCDIFP